MGLITGSELGTDGASVLAAPSFPRPEPTLPESDALLSFCEFDGLGASSSLGIPLSSLAFTSS